MTINDKSIGTCAHSSADSFQVIPVTHTLSPISQEHRMLEGSGRPDAPLGWLMTVCRDGT